MKVVNVDEVLKILHKYGKYIFVTDEKKYSDMVDEIANLRAQEQESTTGHCKDCKYFEYNSMAKVDGIPLIVAHEICSRWGDGCKTKEDGYCFLYEPQERSDKE